VPRRNRSEGTASAEVLHRGGPSAAADTTQSERHEALTAPKPTAHPSASLLAAYATGWIPWPAHLAVQVHLEGCSKCRSEADTLGVFEAKFVDQLPDAPLAPDALQKLVAKLLDTRIEAPSPVLDATLAGVPLPAALADSARIGSLRRLAPGSWFAPIWKRRTAQDCRIYILRAPPGQQLPRLHHSGPELISVLMGAVGDEQRYQAGDFVEILGSSERRLTVTRDGACACLIAQRGPVNGHPWPSYGDGDARRSAALRARPN